MSVRCGRSAKASSDRVCGQFFARNGSAGRKRRFFVRYQFWHGGKYSGKAERRALSTIEFECLRKQTEGGRNDIANWKQYFYGNFGK